MSSGASPSFQSNYHYSGPPSVPTRGPSPTQDSSIGSSMVNPNKSVVMGQHYGEYGSGSSQGHSHEGHGHSHGQGHGHSHSHKSDW